MGSRFYCVTYLTIKMIGSLLNSLNLNIKRRVKLICLLNILENTGS